MTYFVCKSQSGHVFYVVSSSLSISPSCVFGALHHHPPADDFRIFCGDLGNEVNDDILARAFARYPSFLKAKVVRDKRTGKTKGYGFVSFKDPNDYVRAMREMNGEEHLCYNNTSVVVLV